MATIYYARLDEFWRKEQKYDFLEQAKHVGAVEWQELNPDYRHVWLTSDTDSVFSKFVSIGSKEGKADETGDVIFRTYSTGVMTGRDAWAYNFDRTVVAQNMQQAINVYNEHVRRREMLGSAKAQMADYIENDNKKISWSEKLKLDLMRGRLAYFDSTKIRVASYRPFTKLHLYFDSMLTEKMGQFPIILPNSKAESENRVIWFKVGMAWPTFALMVNDIPDRLPQSGSQCFPFYTYAEDGSNRRENITDWALAQFQQRYPPSPITQSPLSKWDIFHYVYALLHHPEYRTKYAANLRRELPRLPFVEDFWGFAQAGAQLAALHVGYESQPEYRLDLVENPAKPLDWRVERMKLSKDKSSLVYNDFLTLAGIPPQVYEYKLGNRSALEWVVDQYQVSTDKRSGIVNDPNNPADPQYIVRLIGQVITVSLETVRIVNHLPPLTILEAT